MPSAAAIDGELVDSCACPAIHLQNSMVKWSYEFRSSRVALISRELDRSVLVELAFVGEMNTQIAISCFARDCELSARCDAAPKLIRR